MSASLEEQDGPILEDASSALVLVETLLRDGRLSRSNMGRRATTESMRHIPQKTLRAGAEEVAEVGDYERPKTRGDCVDGERPCPFIACRYHLAVDVHQLRGSIKTNHPDVPVESMVETCALDVADRGPVTLEEIGEMLNITRERVRQIETMAIAKAERRAALLGLKAAELFR